MRQAENLQSNLVVPVSVGEVIDKITILRIKKTRIKDTIKLSNITKELSALEAIYSENVNSPFAAIHELTNRLQDVNEKLWDIEDKIRECELCKDFGNKFIELARAVYFTNDERANIKREINLIAGSTLIEEKSYKDYASN